MTTLPSRDLRSKGWMFDEPGRKGWGGGGEWWPGKLKISILR